jgi:hypothetical protein
VSLPVFPTLPGLTFTVVKSPEFNTLDQKSPNGYEVRISQTLNPMWHFTLVYEFLHDFPWGNYPSISELRTLMGFFNAQSGMGASFLFTDPDDSYVGPALSTAQWQANTYQQLNTGILDSANHWQQVTTAGMSGATVPTWNHAGGTTTDSGAVWTDKGLYSASGFPNAPFAQLQLVNDGAGNYYSPIQRTLDGNFYEDVTDLNGGIAVYANGVLATQGSLSGQYLVQGPGLAISGSSYMGLYLKWTGTPTPPITAQFNYYFRVRFESDSLDFEKFMGVGSAAVQAGQGGGYWTIGGSESMNGSGYLKLCTARPNPL